MKMVSDETLVAAGQLKLGLLSQGYFGFEAFHLIRLLSMTYAYIECIFFSK